MSVNGLVRELRGRAFVKEKLLSVDSLVLYMWNLIQGLQLARQQTFAWWLRDPQERYTDITEKISSMIPNFSQRHMGFPLVPLRSVHKQKKRGNAEQIWKTCSLNEPVTSHYWLAVHLGWQPGCLNSLIHVSMTSYLETGQVLSWNLDCRCPTLTFLPT